MTDADTAAILGALRERPSRYTADLRMAVWRATRNWYSEDAVYGHLRTLVAAGWVERTGTRYRITETGRRMHDTHVARKQVPA